MSRSKLVDIEVELVHETDMAWLVRNIEDDPEAYDPVWIPKSRGELSINDDTLTLTIPESLAIEKELV